MVLDRVNAAGGLETLSLSTDSELGRQTEPGINGPYPEDMPPVNFPEIDCDDPQDREKILAAWVRAHYYVWRGYQLMEFIGSSGGCRETYWSDGYRSDLEAANWSPRNWFGSFIKFRFDAVRKVVDKTWDRFRTNKAGGIDITLRCVEFEDTLDPCFSGTPGAYNFPVGAISLCPVVLREENETHQRAQLLVHEMLHHTGVSWKPDDLWFGDTVKDVQFHGGHVDKPCGLGVVEKMYGAERAMHLSLTPTCGHPDVAFRNVDNYAFYFGNVGVLVFNGTLTSFPTEGPCWNSPPNPPDNPCAEIGDNTNQPPADPYTDPPDSCTKVGQEIVCPPSGTGGGIGLIQPQCVAVAP
ncbi:MAG: hypothetical protein AAFY60_05755 [Myxococcota bacterium]